MRAVIGSCIDTARRTRYALATIAMIISPGTTLAEILSCRDQDMTVEAPTAELANRVCSVAKASRERLASCHLRQTEPFRIEVKNDLPPEYHGCFGIYLCDESLVQVLTPDSLAEAVKREGIFTEVPIDVFFESVLIHEISHVFAYQSSSGPPRTAAETEYVAYAMQMELMPAAVRDTFVAAHPITRPVARTALNDVILAYSPEVFAVKAWTHFNTEGNGCAFIRRILERKVSFGP